MGSVTSSRQRSRSMEPQSCPPQPYSVHDVSSRSSLHAEHPTTQIPLLSMATVCSSRSFEAIAGKQQRTQATSRIGRDARDQSEAGTRLLLIGRCVFSQLSRSHAFLAVLRSRCASQHASWLAEVLNCQSEARNRLGADWLHKAEHAQSNQLQACTRNCTCTARCRHDTASTITTTSMRARVSGFAWCSTRSEHHAMSTRRPLKEPCDVTRKVMPLCFAA